MASAVQSLAQSESKRRFIERMEMDLTDLEDRKLYNLMKAEAIETREMMSGSRHILLPHLQHDDTVKPPYAISQVTESAMQAAIGHMYNNASSETRTCYDKGHDLKTLDTVTGQAVPHNWVIRWMLWHVFRYRDSRNRKCAKKPEYLPLPTISTTSLDSYSEPDFSPETYVSTSPMQITLAPLQHLETTSPYLPSISSHMNSTSPSLHSKPFGSLRYDPVRDM